MMENRVIRCPVCGSVHLEPRYNTKKHSWWAVYDRIAYIHIPFLDNLLGKIGIETSSARNRNAPMAFWVCQVCGETFPMV